MRKTLRTFICRDCEDTNCVLITNIPPDSSYSEYKPKRCAWRDDCNWIEVK